MLDIRLIRQDAERVKQAMRDRQNEMDGVIDEIVDIDRQRRELSAKNDEMRAEQNKVTTVSYTHLDVYKRQPLQRSPPRLQQGGFRSSAFPVRRQ